MTDTEPAQADTSTTPDVRVSPETVVAAVEVKAAPVDPALAAKVLKQVEFYFGNSNLPKDNHLRGLTQKNEGWVEIAHIASFPKMLALTKDFNAVVTAIRGSKELLEVDETGTRLRRRVPVPDDLDLNPFSIYSKGLPKDWSQEQVEAYFMPHLQAGEEIKCTRLRRFKDKTFKGSIFMELSTTAAAERLTKLELKAPDETRTEPLLILMKAAYFKKKTAERNAEKEQRKGGGGGVKMGDNESGGKRKRDEDGGEEKREFTRVFNPGCIITVLNLPASVDKFKLSQVVAATGAKVAFVDRNQEGPSFVRIGKDSEVSAADAIAKMVDVKFEEQKPEFAILEGDAEKAHWEKIWDAQERYEGNRGGRGRGRRGGRGGGGGRGRGGGKKQRRDD